MLVEYGKGNGFITYPISFVILYGIVISSKHGDYFPVIENYSNTQVRIYGRHIANYNYSNITGSYIAIGI